MNPTDELIELFLSEAARRDPARLVQAVSSCDRYQASEGLHDAVAVLRAAADELGLPPTTVAEYPADGAKRWWSFRAPCAWTPLKGSIRIGDPARPWMLVDHARHPMALATYSTDTGENLLVRLAGPDAPREDASPRVLMLGRDWLAARDPTAICRSAGAIGFVSDLGAPDAEHRGRIELDPESGLFAFSLTPKEMRSLRSRPRDSSLALVTIRTDRSAAMPVLECVLSGHEPGPEVWMIAHLCHPRPSANDNASGVAAALHAAAVIHRSQPGLRPRRTIRVIWGPEFTGIAATLWDHLHLRGAPPPSAVVNLDMVGEDQAACGCPFVLELPPRRRATDLTGAAIRIVSGVFARTADHPGDWRTKQYAGLSDHAVLADEFAGAETFHLCHVPDRHNHSSADTPDKVDPIELRRAVVAGAAIATIAARTPLSGKGARSAPARSPLENARSAVGIRRWDGPFNARGMMADLPPRERVELQRVLRTHRSHFELLMTLAACIDERSTRAQVLSEAIESADWPAAEAAAELLVRAERAGWIAQADMGDAVKPES